jgi:hypothetical protein
MEGQFEDADGPADPGAVTLTIRKPDDTLETIEEDDLTSTTVGTWSYDYTIEQEGRHYYDFAGVGGVVALEPGEFYVERNRVRA